MNLVANLVITSMDLLYIPRIKASVAPEIPGIIFAIPIIIPFKIFTKKRFKFIVFVILFLNMQHTPQIDYKFFEFHGIYLTYIQQQLLFYLFDNIL